MTNSIVIIVLAFLFMHSCSSEKKETGKNERSFQNELEDFLFAGLINENSGLYKYNLAKNEYSRFWSDKDEQVIEISYSENNKNVFFTTAEDYGLSGAFPFIKDVKIYIINPETGKAEFVEKIGSGLQVFTRWIDESNFKVIINAFDKSVANYVTHRVMLFNSYGKKMKDKTEMFDITKEGYPQLPDKKINYSSPENKFSLEIKENDSISVFLKENNKKKLIMTINQEIKRIEWKNDFVFISSISIKPDNETLYTENPETSKLIIYSLPEKEIVRMWEGGGLKNFFIIDNFIAFDTGFEDNSKIIIYDYLNKKTVDEIKIEGGCGIRSVPKIPDYGA